MKLKWGKIKLLNVTNLFFSLTSACWKRGVSPQKNTERYSVSNFVCVKISSYLPAKSVKYACGTRLPLSFIIKSRVFLLKLQNPTSCAPCASVTGWGSRTSHRSWMTHEYHRTWLSTWTPVSDRAVMVGLLDKTVFPVVLQFPIPFMFTDWGPKHHEI